MSLEDRAKEVFGITKNDVDILKEKDGLLIMQIPIDVTKYKNRLSSYSEILKEYFRKDRIYVLSKIRHRKGLSNIFAILFQNSKNQVMNEMKSFTPSYLIKRGTKKILVTQGEDYLTLCELPSECDSSFIFDGYRYKEANEIKLN